MRQVLGNASGDPTDAGASAAPDLSSLSVASL